MDDFLSMALSNSVDDLFQYGNSFILRDFFYGFYFFLKRAVFAVFNDH
jgi:hypothetical protein